MSFEILDFTYKISHIPLFIEYKNNNKNIQDTLNRGILNNLHTFKEVTIVWDKPKRKVGVSLWDGGSIKLNCSKISIYYKYDSFQKTGTAQIGHN